MASSIIDTDSVSTTGTRLGALGEGASPPTGVMLAPAAADPVSMAVAATLQARATGIDAYTAVGAAVTLARGQHLNASAAAYARQEVSNAASLGADGGDGGATAVPAAPPAVALPAVPPVTAPAIGAPPGRGREIAELIHAGPGTETLHTAVQQLRGHATLLRTVGNHLTNTSRDVTLFWPSESGELAAHRVGQLGTWFQDHADHADAAAYAVVSHAESFERAKANIPTPAQFADVENRLKQAAAANANPATLGRYAPVVTALQTRLSSMNTQALTQYATYSGHANGPEITGGPLTPPPQPGGAAGPDDVIVGPPDRGAPTVHTVDWKTGPPLPQEPPPPVPGAPGVPQPSPGAQPQIGPFPVPPQVAAQAPNIAPRPLDPTGGLLTPQDLPPATPPPPIPGVMTAPSPGHPPVMGPPPSPALPSYPDLVKQVQQQGQQLADQGNAAARPTPGGIAAAMGGGCVSTGITAGIVGAETGPIDAPIAAGGCVVGALGGLGSYLTGIWANNAFSGAG